MKGTFAFRGQRHDGLLPAPKVPFGSSDEARIYLLERRVVDDLQRHGWVASTVDAADVLVLIEPPAAAHPPFRSGELDGRPFFAIATDPDRAIRGARTKFRPPAQRVAVRPLAVPGQP